MTNDQWVAKFDIPSDSNPKKTYTVSMREDGVWGCSCQAWTFQRAPPERRKHCKHIEKVLHMPGVSSVADVIASEHAKASHVEHVPSTAGTKKVSGAKSTKTEEVSKMEAKVIADCKATIEAYVASHPGCHIVSDAWKVGSKKYIYFATRNGYPLQFDGKRIGTARSLSEVEQFLNTDYQKELGKTATAVPSTPKTKEKPKEEKVMKDVLLTPPTSSPAEECPSSEPKEEVPVTKRFSEASARFIKLPTKDMLVEADRLGIKNANTLGFYQCKWAIFFAHPINRARHADWEQRLKSYGAECEPVSLEQYRASFQKPTPVQEKPKVELTEEQIEALIQERVRKMKELEQLNNVLNLAKHG